MARKKNVLPGSIFVVRGQLVLKIRLNNEIDRNGKPKYRKIYTKLADTPANRKLVEKKQYELHVRQFLPKREETRVIRIQEAFELFLQSKNLLPKTVKNYKLAFDTITRKQNYVLTFDNLEEDVLYFKNRTAVQRNFSAVTINTYLRGFQVFLNFCTERKFLEQTKFKAQFGQREIKKEVQIFTDEEVSAILKDCAERDRELGLLVGLMVETGARPVDALNLKCTDVDLANGVVNWRNKITKNIESTPISARAREVLREALALAGGRERVFRWQHSSLPRVADRLKASMKRAGVEKNGRSFKNFRTTFKFRIRNLPFEFQMRLMRHSSPDVTLGHYTFYDNNEIRERLDAVMQKF
jgi:integrase